MRTTRTPTSPSRRRRRRSRRPRPPREPRRRRGRSGAGCETCAQEGSQPLFTCEEGGSMPTRKADAKWEGGVPDGNGTVRLGSGAFEGPYSFQSRFEDGSGTNPEELIGAAHAGCFTMALSLILTQGGNPPESVETNATVHL